MGVKILEGSKPKPKPQAVITKTKLFVETATMLANGHEVQVKLPESFMASRGIDPKHAVNSFKVSLARYVDRHLGGKYWVYVVDSIIYAVKVKS